MFSLKRFVGPLTIFIAIFYAIGISNVFFTDSPSMNYNHYAYYTQSQIYASEVAPEYGGVDDTHNSYQIYPFSSNTFINIFVVAFHHLTGSIFSDLFCYQFLVFLSFILVPFSVYFFLRQFGINTPACTAVLLIALFESGGLYLGGFQGVYYYSEVLSSLACAFAFFVFGFSVKIFKGHPRNIFMSCCFLFMVLFLLISFFVFSLVVLLVFAFLTLNVAFSQSTAKRFALLVFLPLLLSCFILLPLLYYNNDYEIRYIVDTNASATSALRHDLDITIYVLGLLGAIAGIYYLSAKKTQFFELLLILGLIATLSLALAYLDRRSVFTMGVSNLEYLIFFRISLIALSGVFFQSPWFR